MQEWRQRIFDELPLIGYLAATIREAAAMPELLEPVLRSPVLVAKATDLLVAKAADLLVASAADQGTNRAGPALALNARSPTKLRATRRLESALKTRSRPKLGTCAAPRSGCR
jgi:hypothetical protein